MAMPLRPFSLILNPTMEFNQRALSARGYIRNCYLGKVAPCTISLWRLRPQASKTLASRRRRCQHMEDRAKVNDSSRSRPLPATTAKPMRYASKGFPRHNPSLDTSLKDAEVNPLTEGCLYKCKHSMTSKWIYLVWQLKR